MATLRQKSSFGPGVYRGIPFDRERLQRFVEGTNRAIQAGVPIPLLKKHAPINADDKATQQFADAEGSGWVKKLALGDDGSLEWEADNVPEEVVKAAEAGTLKFTSPEFRNQYMSEKEGVYQGPIVRHIAFTPVPGNPHQGPIEAIALQEEGVFQFSEADLEKKLDEPEADSQHAEREHASVLHEKLKKMGWNLERGGAGTHVYDHPEHLDKLHIDPAGKWEHRTQEGKVLKSGTKHDEIHPHLEVYHGDGPKGHLSYNRHSAKQYAEEPQPLSALPPGVTPPEEQNNPDMPPRFNNPAKMAAVLAGLAQKGVVLPSDFSFEDDAAIDILLAALNSSIKAENEAEAAAAADVQPESPPTEAAMPFSEAHQAHLLALDLHGYTPHVGSKMRYFSHEAGHSVTIHGDGSWTHTDPKGTIKEGIDHGSLKQHLQSIHGKDSQHSEQFSEEEINALPEKFRDALRRERDNRVAAERAAEEARQQALQFAENEARTRNNAARDRAKEGIKAAKLPPSLREKLLKAYDDSEAAVQFNEGAEQPHFTASQVAELVAASLPPALQFMEDAVKEADAPKVTKQIGKDVNGKPIMGHASSEQFFEQGDLPAGHVSPERAEELVRSNPVIAFQSRPWTPPTVDNFVSQDNSRFPNKVMNP